jgi:hypothetical protein
LPVNIVTGPEADTLDVRETTSSFQDLENGGVVRWLKPPAIRLFPSGELNIDIFISIAKAGDGITINPDRQKRCWLVARHSGCYAGENN